MPNDWSRSVTEATVVERELSEHRLLQLEYWDAFLQSLRDANGPVDGNRKPQPKQWMSYGIGMGGFNLATVINLSENYARVELYINGEGADQRLDRLEQLREEIELDLGFKLVWGDQYETARDRRISCYLRDIDLRNKTQWPEQHRWLAERLNTMHRAFASRLIDY